MIVGKMEREREARELVSIDLCMCMRPNTREKQSYSSFTSTFQMCMIFENKEKRVAYL